MTDPTESDAHLDDLVLSRFVDDDLGDDELSAAHGHLGKCAVCAGRVEQMRAIARIVAAERSEADEVDRAAAERAVTAGLAAYDEQATAASRQVRGRRRRGAIVGSVAAAAILVATGLAIGIDHLATGGASFSSGSGSKSASHNELASGGNVGSGGTGNAPPSGGSTGKTNSAASSLTRDPATTLQLRPIERTVSCNGGAAGRASAHRSVVERLSAPVGSGCVVAGPAAVVVVRSDVARIVSVPRAGTALIDLHGAPSGEASGRFLIVLGGGSRSLAISLGELHGDAIGTGRLSKESEATLTAFAHG